MPTTSIAGDASARLVGIGLSVLAVLLLVVVAWIALRRRRRDEPAVDRVIGWDRPRLPADVVLPDSPRESGQFLDMTTMVEESDAQVAFYPPAAMLRHDPVRAADNRADALLARVDGTTDIAFASPYAVISVELHPMQAPVSVDAVAEHADVVAADGIGSAAVSPGNRWSDRIDDPSARPKLVFAAAYQQAAPPGHDIEDEVAEVTTQPTSASKDVPSAADPSQHARDEDVDATGAPLLGLEPEPPIRTGEAWARTGHYWWRLAWHGEQPDASALEHAGEAFERALALEPERAMVLSRMLSRCHRALASLSTGGDRVRHLDAALSALDAHFDASTVDDDTRLEWAGILVESAEAAPPGDGACRMDRAEQLIEAAATKDADGTDTEALRLQARIALARSRQARGNERLTLEDAAINALLRGVEQSAGTARGECLAELIEVERVRMARMNSAALVAHGQQVHSRLTPWLATAGSIEPLLAWLRLLGDWSGHLRGEAARRKLAEAEPLFRAIEALAPDARDGVRFARAFYLRLRARNEVGSARIATLREGLRELTAVNEGSSYPVTLEAAQMHLAVAEAIGGLDARADYVHAVDLTQSGMDDATHAGAALTCALTAQLAMAETVPVDVTAREAMRAWSSRLLALAPGDADALRLHARVLLLDHDPRAASERCAAAWDAGADGLRLLPVWRRASDEWAQAANTEPDQTAWRNNRQHFRTASASLH